MVPPYTAPCRRTPLRPEARTPMNRDMVGSRSPLLGRWNFNVPTPVGQRGAWLEVVETDGVLEAWHQPTGGHVVRLPEAVITHSHMTFVSPGSATRPATLWALEAQGDVLVGHMTRDAVAVPLTGRRAPALDRRAPAAWSSPQPLLNGRDLDGWVPLGAPSQWVVTDGLLVNRAKGANLVSVRTFQDFRLHFEIRGEDGANSGCHLRGRYEVQLEFEPLSKNPPERRIGSIYGRLAPAVELPREAHAWQAFDVTLVGRTVTIVHNGVTTIDQREIAGVTGGALDADEADAGPFVLQGDHTGGLAFRRLTVSVPQASSGNPSAPLP